MIKRISRNFKVPLVTGGQWKDHQNFQKWDPVSKRLITVNCCLPEKCYEPDPVTNVVISDIQDGSVVVSWTYAGPPVEFEINIYASPTEEVNTSGTPVFSSIQAFTSGSPVYFSNIANYYYAVSVRVRNRCLFSTYAYSNTLQYVFLGYNFAINSLSYTVDPTPTGCMDSFSENYILDWTLNFSTTDHDSNNVVGFLNTLSTRAVIKVQKDLDNYHIYVRRAAAVDNGTYWYFPCYAPTVRGGFHVGDIVNVTYSESYP